MKDNETSNPTVRGHKERSYLTNCFRQGNGYALRVHLKVSLLHPSKLFESNSEYSETI